MRALGIDYGRRRIGLALSDPTGMLARPWKAIECRGGVRGAADALAAEIEALAASLRDLTSCPVVLQDERLSSREAEARLALREKDWRKRKPLLDAAAAAVILQDYLDARSPGQSGEDDSR